MGDRRAWLLLAVSALAIGGLMLAPPLAQDPAYHEFADRRSMLGVPNFWNVATNLPFMLVAALGLARLPSLSRPVPGHAFGVLCAGVLLVTFGSGYYHWAPDNATLAWDRLPMTIAFMALLALVIGERVSEKLGRRLLVPLVLAGAASVIYWRWTELLGIGDLRPYALIQFLPLLLIPLMVGLYPRRHLNEHRLWAALGCYVAAKVAEHFDRAIFDALGCLSGHSIKHVLAAVAIWFVISAVGPGRVRPGPLPRAM